MPHELTELRLDAVTRPATGPVHEITADVCVVGAGIAGSLRRDRVGAARPLRGARRLAAADRRADGAFADRAVRRGLRQRPGYTQLTHGDLRRHLRRARARRRPVLLPRPHHDGVLQRGRARPVAGADRARPRHPGRSPARCSATWCCATGSSPPSSLATRYGDVRVRAAGYVDASGDAALTWQAGLPCWVPSRPIYGSQQVIVENLDEAHKPEPGEIDAVFAARGEEFGLLRRGGLAFFFPGRGTAVLNVTHIDAPLDPVDASRAMFEGRDQADARDRAAQGRVPEGVRRGAGAGLRVPRAAADAVDPRRAPAHRRRGARRAPSSTTRWRGRRGRWNCTTGRDGYVWEMFPADHVHYVPLRSMLPPGAHNLVAAGRCIDGDAAALSSVRVMGPCSAMGFAAAHVLDLASGRQHELVRDDRFRLADQRARHRPGAAAVAARREPRASPATSGGS